MGDFVLSFLEGVGRWFSPRRRGLLRLLALAVVIVALPFAALAMLPTVLSLFAPPLDRGVDLYSVNRPLAFTFLDEDGAEVGHRGAIIGDRLRLKAMTPY